MTDPNDFNMILKCCNRSASDDAVGAGCPMDRRVFLKWTAMAGMNTLLFGCNTGEQPPRPLGSQSQELVMATAVDLYTIDPAVGFDTAIGNSLVSFYDSLFRYFGNPPEVIPWLARSYSVSPDLTVWTFHLEKTACFHDGSKVNAAAVKYSLERLLRIRKGPASLFTGVVADQGAQVLDDDTLQIKLQKPYGAFIYLLPWFFVVNPSVVRSHSVNDHGQSWLRDHEAGSGPFVMGAWKPGDLYEFKAVDDYWKGWHDGVHLKRYTRKVIKDADARLRALEQGKAHVADWISPGQQVQYRSRSGFYVVEEPSMALFEIKMNNRGRYTSDLHLRKAIAYAFDYQALLDIWKGRAVLAGGPLPQGLSPGADVHHAYRFDLNRAFSELKRSAWPTGGFVLDYVYVAGLEQERRVGEILCDQLASLNIKINMIPMAWTDAVSMFQHYKTAPDLFPLYSLDAYPDPDNYLWAGYHSSQAGQWTNPGHYQSEKMDHLLEQARAAITRQDRNRLYRHAYNLALEGAINIFGVSSMDAHVYTDTVYGIKYCPVTCNQEDFYWVHLKA